MKVRLGEKEYDVPADGVIDSHRHGELFWHLTLRDLFGIEAPLEIVPDDGPDLPAAMPMTEMSDE